MVTIINFGPPKITKRIAVIAKKISTKLREAISVNITEDAITSIDDCSEITKFSSQSEWLIPEYLVEYTAYNDLQFSAPIAKILLEVSFSNRISDTNMPAIVGELTKSIAAPISIRTTPISVDPLSYDSLKEYVEEYQVSVIYLI